jgi:hypothetical protein
MIIPSFLSEASTPAPVRADLAVYLSGWHVAETVALARRVLMVFPSARLSIGHPQPVHAALRAWCDAERLAADVLPRTCAHPAPPESTVSARVVFDAPVVGVHVDALSARTGSSGRAQVRVRLGALLIIAADRDAVACQLRLWQAAARHADRLWPTSPEQSLPVPVDFPGLPAAAAEPERTSA